MLCEETEETSQDQMGDPSSEVSADSTDVQDTTAMEDVSDKQAEVHSDVGGSEVSLAVLTACSRLSSCLISGQSAK